MPDGLTDYFPITEDVDYEYKMRRQDGKDRAAAVREILEENADYLSTCDDGPQVWIGIAKAMGRKAELTREILEKAESAFDELARAFPEEQKLLARYKVRICDPNKLGSEARYVKRKAYDPGWRVGDTFTYRLRTEEAKSIGMDGWIVILRKAGDWMDYWHHHNHLFYMSICPPDRVPKTEEELNVLGYLPFQPRYKRNGVMHYEFYWSIYVSGEKQMQRYNLEYLGHFPDVIKPSCEAEYSELRPANPLFPVNKDTDMSSLDFYGIFSYRNYGLIK